MFLVLLTSAVFYTTVINSCASGMGEFCVLVFEDYMYLLFVIARAFAKRYLRRTLVLSTHACHLCHRKASTAAECRFKLLIDVSSQQLTAKQSSFVLAYTAVPRRRYRGTRPTAPSGPWCSPVRQSMERATRVRPG